MAALALGGITGMDLRQVTKTGLQARLVTSGQDPNMLWPQRSLRTLHRKSREVRMVARGLQSVSHPLLAQIVPIRRCNLACTCCNEYDKHSQPVPVATLRDRLDHVARLRTANVEISPDHAGARR